MKLKKIFAFSILLISTMQFSQAQNNQQSLKISGVYPHLAVYNPGDKFDLCPKYDGRECGIGAIVPWAGKLWMVTYSPHCPEGSSDRLWTIDNNLNLEMHPASIGGTPANRLIHKETEQLIIGPYFISKEGDVREIPYNKMPGRHTATARHLFDPANKVYFQDMEGKVYEVNVHSLKVNKLFEKPVPGWHGKGAYTGQGRYIIANNGESGNYDKIEHLQTGSPAKTDEEMGSLAEWDGETWRIIERKQFTDVTGPGGIYGNENNSDPVWSMGWDKRSVILKVLDNNIWFTYRLPKSSNAYENKGGFYTEWPRIREVTNGKYLMDMFGMFYDFPKTFSQHNSSGIKPVSTHLRYTTDFCEWNEQLVIGNDETSLCGEFCGGAIGNEFAGRSWSNLWFGKWTDLKEWGPVRGHGGPWVSDLVRRGQPSDPYLFNGYDHKVLHLAHDNLNPVIFTIEYDAFGNGEWSKYRDIRVTAKGYDYFIFPNDFKAEWVRIVSDTDCRATAVFHYNQKGYNPADMKNLFAGLADVNSKGKFNYSMIMPAAHNLSLQMVDFQNKKETYYELDERLNFQNPEESRAIKVKDICVFYKEFEEDEASVIMNYEGNRVRLPKGDSAFSKPFNGVWPRGIRSMETDRMMLNIHGTLYEMPHEAGLNALRPVASHKKKIIDFCTWRGMVVLSGIDSDAKNDGHIFRSENKKTGLWFGHVDDLWKLGKAVGKGGPWKNTDVISSQPSDKYLMTGYDHKTLELVANKDVKITAEIDVDFYGWHVFKTFSLKAGEKLVYKFPVGFNAHWIRFKSDKDCKATAWLIYN
jgi:hypothetical protein